MRRVTNRLLALLALALLAPARRRSLGFFTLRFPRSSSARRPPFSPSCS